MSLRRFLGRCDFMKIHLVKAQDGDCFVLDFENGKCILIDGGYDFLFENSLEPLLSQLNEQGKTFEYVISTHYDQDHISGLITFIEKNGMHGKEKIIPIENIITNGFGALAAEKVQELIPDSERSYMDGIHEISARQQLKLDEVCNNYHYPMNVCTNGSFVTAGTIVKGTGYTIRFLSPSINNLEKLKADLEKHQPIPVQPDNRKNETVEISGDFYTDISEWKNIEDNKTLNAVNKASIACEIEFNGKYYLFCGDSEMKEVRNELRECYDVIKLSHHGTYHGNQCFVGEHAVISKNYIILTNAKRHDREHPSRKLLQGIIMLPSNKDLYCNYDILDVKGGIYKLLGEDEQQRKYSFTFETDCICIKC